MSEAVRKERTAFQRRLFYWINRVPYWTMRAVNGVIGKSTRDYEVHPRELFPWIDAVEENFPEALQEVQRLVQHMTHLPTVHEIVPTTDFYYSERDWRQVIFYCHGHRVEDHCALYPAIDKALRQVPGMITGSISILEPGEVIPAHEHVYKGLLIFHWGLVIPGTTENDCAIRVGGTIKRWDEGKVFVIDPTYAHDVWNRTDSRRVILLGEFRRPDMPRILRFLDSVYIAIFNASPIGRTMIRKVREIAALHRAEIEAFQTAPLPPAATGENQR